MSDKMKYSWGAIIGIFFLVLTLAEGIHLYAINGISNTSETPWLVIPQPKRMQLSGERHNIKMESPVFISSEPARLLFAEEMKVLGKSITVKLRASTPPQCVWGNSDTAVLKKQMAAIDGRTEGYVLSITSSSIGIISGDEDGLRNGIQTLLQLIEQSDMEIPCGDIIDWPDISFRAMHTTLRPPSAFGQTTVDETIAVYEWMIRRLARYKYNHLCLLVDGIELKSCPESGFGPWTGVEMRRLTAFARAYGITLFPEVKTLGKFFRQLPEAAVQKYANLLEPQKYIGQLDWQAKFHEGYKQKAKQLEEEERAFETESSKKRKLSADFKIADPAVFDFIAPILDEVYDMFDKPPVFNIGCDESFYTAIDAPQNERGNILASYINRVAAHLMRKGARVMIWDDMLTSHERFPFFYETHGGPPLDTWRAIDHLDRNIIIASWHYGYTVAGHYPEHYPMMDWFVQKGFTLIGVPWFKQDNIINIGRDVHRLNGMGVMGSSWAVHMAIRAAAGGPFTEKQLKTITPRHELNVLAATAEATWTPNAADTALLRYSPELWEKNFLPKGIKCR